MLLITTVIWGIQFPLAKYTFETVNAFHSAIFRFGLPAIVLLIVLLLREGVRALHLNAESCRVMAIGVLGMTGAPTFIFGGLMFTRPEIAAIVVATQPLLTVLIQSAFGGRTSALTIFCVLLAFFGVITVVTRWQSISDISGVELIAMVCIMFGALCWVLYTIACGRYRHWSNLRLTTLSLLSGASVNTLIAFLLVALGFIDHPTISAWLFVKWELLFLALIGVLVPMILWNGGARRVGALNAMLFINLIPVVTFAIRYAQGYQFENIELLGATLVVVALLTQNMAMRRQLNTLG